MCRLSPSERRCKGTTNKGNNKIKETKNDYLINLPSLYPALVFLGFLVVADADEKDVIIFTIYEFTIYDYVSAVSIK